MEAIQIVALGPGSAQLLTLGALEALTAGERVILRTARHGAAAELARRGVAFETLDELYERSEDFDELCERAAARLIQAAGASGRIVYGVSDPLSDETVYALLRAVGNRAAIEVLPGVTLAAYGAAAALSAGAQTGNLCQAAALSAGELEPDPERPLMVTEIDGRVLAGEVKLWLMDVYDAEQIVFFSPPGEAGRARARTIPLWELDRQAAYDHTCTLLVPPAPYERRTRHTVRDLQQIMRRLRAADGCPWDRAQTHESLRQYLIEEAYEVVDAVDSGDPARVADELGDVLLQVMFHAQIAAEHADFTLSDVATAICSKMISRHERLFGGAGTDTAGDAGWEAVKRREKGQKTLTQSLRDVPGYLPALMRAAKVLRKAASAGFDPLSGANAIEQAERCANAAQEAMKRGKDASRALGALLLAAAGASRSLGAQPELLLGAATDRFVARFERMERAASTEGRVLTDCTGEDINGYWAKACEEEDEIGKFC